MKKRWLKVILWVGLATVLLVVTAAVWAWAEMGGEIPQTIDSNDGWYERVVDIQPTSGKIWYSSMGWRTASNFIRLHLSHADFDRTFHPEGPDSFSQGLPIPSGPIWWNPDPNGQCSHDKTKFEEIWIFYDTKRELLYERIDL